MGSLCVNQHRRRSFHAAAARILGIAFPAIIGLNPWKNFFHVIFLKQESLHKHSRDLLFLEVPLFAIHPPIA
jgi:hypothetical protein